MAFVLAAQMAFGKLGNPLDRELQACLTIAYHKLRRA